MVDIEEALSQQSEAARRQQNEIKRYIFITWIYMVIVSLIFSFSIYSMGNSVETMSQTNKDLSAVLERRSPVLEYLKCRDDLESINAFNERAWLLSYVEAGPNVTAEEQNKIDLSRLNYDKSSKNLLNSQLCPDFPN